MEVAIEPQGIAAMNDEKNDVVHHNAIVPQVDQHLSVGPSNAEIDVTGLTVEQIQALKIKYAEMSIEWIERGRTIGTDAQSLGATLETLSRSTAQMSEQGTNVTITNTRDDALGRTEMIVGNSDAARKGKLSMTQKGLGDPTMLYMGFALVVLVILALVFISISG